MLMGRIGVAWRHWCVLLPIICVRRLTRQTGIQADGGPMTRWLDVVLASPLKRHDSQADPLPLNIDISTVLLSTQR